LLKEGLDGSSIAYLSPNPVIPAGMKRESIFPFFGGKNIWIPVKNEAAKLLTRSVNSA